MKEYDFKAIEEYWQNEWKNNSTYKVFEDKSKPKCYVLDMFPYPSGAGLHVGHPLGYIASDIYSRYKRLCGYEVLHPMGYDSFGLPAEQYAIQTGQHPAITTESNIARYREQLNKMGFSFDWTRSFRTSDPTYYKWTQWIFIRLFHSFYNYHNNKAEPIENLVRAFESNGSDTDIMGSFENSGETGLAFTAAEWKNFDEKTQQDILMRFRLAYLAESYVNWCPGLGTVLANDEVKDGYSERGGFPVERKLMMQWSLRITVYADRLLADLEKIDWPEPLKETQRNWIGKSTGCSLNFQVAGFQGSSIEVFTTRPDTIFGVTFLTLAPEHELVAKITTTERKKAIGDYIIKSKNRSERDRMADVKRITGEFTGAFAIHSFTGKQIPIWVGDYVLAGYGTGAVMAVPAHDSRDHAFAKHFNLPIVSVIETPEGHNILNESYDAKEGRCIHSDFLDGLHVKQSIQRAILEIEKKGIGNGRTNYRLRDAIFGRQRYWGEPIPVYYENNIPRTVLENQLPLILPEIDKYLPTEAGEPPLARAGKWKWDTKEGKVSDEGYPLETTTMPGWAGSSWYFLRYMDPHNNNEFAGRKAIDYWQNVDLYLGGSEHATGHLLYVRFWTKFLYDLGLIPFDEPAKKLINQGMIQGVSCYFTTLVKENGMTGYPQILISSDIDLKSDFLKDKLQSIGDTYDPEKGLLSGIELAGAGWSKQRIDVNLVRNGNEITDTDKAATWLKQIYSYENIEFIKNENGQFFCENVVEKMSKSKWNVINPDDIISDYGTDTLRLYEMFLGPLEQSKPWNTQGIEGVLRFLKKLWKLFYDEGNLRVIDEQPSQKDLKSIHKLIKKIAEDIDNFSFNTSVPAFMICVNELSDLKCHKKEVLKDLILCLSPYAPHITEELWHALGNSGSIVLAQYPAFKPEFLVEDTFSYPVSINGKHRTNIELSLDMSQPDVESRVLADEIVQKWLEGKVPKKVIFVKGKIVNIVVG